MKAIWKMENGGYIEQMDEKLVPKEEVWKRFAKVREEFISENPGFDENDEECKELEKYINEDGKTYYSYAFNDYIIWIETYEIALKHQMRDNCCFCYYEMIIRKDKMVLLKINKWDLSEWNTGSYGSISKCNLRFVSMKMVQK